ncbi:MAG: polysaccharide biosynthesis C-terminal domain-containing protein [Lachnospiraceae bacterium]|nr:polysaccharide biosynthesis C-terminal domain-containing protein [Lachnospiraceae bacterium]
MREGRQKKEEIQLSDHFTLAKLLRFAFLPTISLLLSSLYSVVDSWFIANFTGQTAFAAVTLTSSYVLVFPAVGFMIGGGGNALIGKTLGEGDRDKANRIFSMLIELCVITGILATVLGEALLRPFVLWQGASGELLSDALQYARLSLCGVTFVSLLYIFQLFLITAGKQELAVMVTIGAGVTNILLDALFILVFKWGLIGAALGTLLGQMAGGLLPLLYFIFDKSAGLRLFPTRIDLLPCLKACGNGASEMIENLAEGVVGILYNFELMRLAGESGVAAYGAIMNIRLIFTLLFVGFDEAVIPVISYHYGAENHRELKNLLRLCLVSMLSASVFMFAVTELFAPFLAALFMGTGNALSELTVRGFRIGGISLLFLGINYLGTSFFTALNNGLVSGILSLLVMLIFPVLTVTGLPVFFGLDGVWGSISLTGLLGCIFTMTALLWGRKQYHY